MKMIKVSVLYPRTESLKFDMKYYLERHIPMVKAKLGAALKSASVDEGLAGASPGQPPSFAVIATLGFESVDAFQNAFGQHAEAIMADLPNYTNAAPTIQISNVLG
jgi:uncharacterized protein (TIGR02118 family)